MAFSRIKGKVQYFLLSSKAYIKKYNLNSDKAAWNGWEVIVRTATHDIFVTALRRKFIPPLMELFQDIIVISTFNIKIQG